MAMKTWAIRAMLTKLVNVTVQAEDAEHAAKRFDAGEYEETLTGIEIANWEMIGEPIEQ